MSKSQKRTLNLFVISLFYFISSSFSGICNPVEERLALADSLFLQKKYTQSFELYREIYETQQMASSSMLLKMAFVQEGLNNFAEALYYLNLYYLMTYDKKALKKMQDLAKKHKLTGYDYNDAAFFLNLYHQYQVHLELLVFSFIALMLGLLVYQKRRNKKIAPFSAATYLLLLGFVLFLNNYGRERTKAIITSNHAYLMDGPSAGANVVDIVSNGHKVNVLGRKDAWVKITWGEKNAYIRDNHLRTISL